MQVPIPGAPAEHLRGEEQIDQVGSVEYAAIVPIGHDAGSDPLPLLLQLHGGGGSRQQLIDEHDSGVWGRRMADGVIPPMVIAMISGVDGTYMDYYDGSQRWATFLQDEFVPFCETTFNCGGQQDMRMALGTSMGGFGVLHLCFGRPDDWGAVAACEPAIDAALDAKDITMRSLRRANESATQVDQIVDPPHRQVRAGHDRPRGRVGRRLFPCQQSCRRGVDHAPRFVPVASRSALRWAIRTI